MCLISEGEALHAVRLPFAAQIHQGLAVIMQSRCCSCSSHPGQGGAGVAVPKAWPCMCMEGPADTALGTKSTEELHQSIREVQGCSLLLEQWAKPRSYTGSLPERILRWKNSSDIKEKTKVRGPLNAWETR